jgi:DNA-binding Xre family transcriptional regulator
MDKKAFKIKYTEILLQEELTVTELAKRNNISPNNLNQKLNRGSIPFIEFANLLESIGYTIKFEKQPQPASPTSSNVNDSLGS